MEKQKMYLGSMLKRNVQEIKTLLQANASFHQVISGFGLGTSYTRDFLQCFFSSYFQLDDTLVFCVNLENN